MGLALFCFLRLSILKQWLYVQNSSSPVGCILPPHLGQVCISHLWILSDPHLRQSLPTRELKLGAASPITPPTTRGTMFLQSGQDMASMCCPMKPRPSYISVSYPHSWHLNIFFFDINNLLFYQFKHQLALEYFPMEKWFVFWLRKKAASFWCEQKTMVSEVVIRITNADVECYPSEEFLKIFPLPDWHESVLWFLLVEVSWENVTHWYNRLPFPS